VQISISIKKKKNYLVGQLHRYGDLMSQQYDPSTTPLFFLAPQQTLGTSQLGHEGEDVVYS